MRLLLAAFLALSSFACGGGPVCGNNATEPGEACDDGNLIDDDLCNNLCEQPGSFEATVIWLPLLANESPGFDETCGGVDADDIELRVTGPLNFTLVVSCSSGQMPIRGLLAGTYNVVGTLYRTDMKTDESTPITRGQAQTVIDIVNVNVTVDLDFSFGDFIESYTGAFFFRTTWAMMEVCATALVQDMTIRLERGGMPLSGLDSNNVPVTFDGSWPVPCRNFAGTSPFSFKAIEWGPAMITLGGLDGSQTEQYASTVGTFVGAGVSNPEMIFDVNSLAPDAGVPDAGVPDAL